MNPWSDRISFFNTTLGNCCYLPIRLRPVNASRTCTSFLTAIVLLTSNIMGLVHVGCESSSHCCVHNSNELIPNRTLTFPQRSATNDGQASHHHCKCNAHSVRYKSRVPASSAQTTVDSAASPQSSGHNSDECSICQNFYVSRLAAFFQPSFAFIGFRNPTVLGLWPSDVVVKPSLRLCNLVRGPPRV